MSELIRTENVSLTLVGLTFIGTITQDEWLDLMATLVRTETAFQFSIGDALVYGESHFGEKYSQAMDATGLSYQTLANLTWVAKQVSQSNRVVGVSWTHHRVVASVDPSDQRGLLEMAKERKMSAVDLNEHITGRQPKSKAILQVPDGLTVEQAKDVLQRYALAIREANSNTPPCNETEADAVLAVNPLCNTCPYRV
jgi:hypothetical protein